MTRDVWQCDCPAHQRERMNRRVAGWLLLTLLLAATALLLTQVACGHVFGRCDRGAAWTTWRQCIRSGADYRFCDELVRKAHGCPT